MQEDRLGRGRRARRTLGLLATVGVAAFAAPGTAAAAWQTIPSPAASNGGVVAFGASGSSWFAVTVAYDGSEQGQLTHDEGQSWQPVSIAPSGGSVSNVSVGPDGAFYVTVQPGNSGQAPVERIDSSGNVTTVATLTGLPTGGSVTAPAFDGSGNGWVGEDPSDYSRFTLARIDGSQSYSVSPSQASAPTLESFAGRIFVSLPPDAYTVSGGSLQKTVWPIWTDGTHIVAENGISFDGGASWVPSGSQSSADGSDGPLLPVHGSTSEYFSGNDLVAPLTPTLLAGTQVTTPVGSGGETVATDYWASSAGTIAVGYGIPSYLGLWPGTPPTRPATRNGSSTSTLDQGVIAHANALRTGLGLPALGEDPLIDKAAFNHSHYWTLNGFVTGLAIHYETQGKPGFTGVQPSDRCTAAGTSCGSEVIYPGVTGPAAVDGWMDSVFHREPFVDPTSDYAGYGMDPAGKPQVSVMDFDFDGSAQALAPVVYPVGNYVGPTAFDNGEVPDPIAQCKQDGQPLPQYPSLPLTITPPLGQVLSIHVTDATAGGAAVSGCTEPGDFGWFMADKPWADGHTYKVAYTWGTAGVPQSSTSSFTIAAGDPTGIGSNNGSSGSGASSKLTVSFKPAVAHFGKTVKIIFNVPAKGMLRWTLTRAGAKHAHPVASGRYRMPYAGTLTTRVFVNFTPGAYDLKLQQGHLHATGVLKVRR